MAEERGEEGRAGEGSEEGMMDGHADVDVDVGAWIG